MGDRTSARIAIGGVLRGEDAIADLVAAIVADGAGDDYEPADEGEAETMVRDAVEFGELVELSANEVNYGDFNVIETVCQRLRLPFIGSWDNGGGYEAGVKRWTPDGERGGTTINFSADTTGEPLVTRNELTEAIAAGKLDELMANMMLCGTASLPPLTVEE